MGLSERRQKQRIGHDPRNLSWSENAAKFGHTYLEKLGWNPSLGLGKNEDGRTTNIAVAMKLDQLGIGAGRGSGADKDGVAWKQQTDFERMLARLNSTTSPVSGPSIPQEVEGVVAGLGFAAASQRDQISGESVGSEVVKTSVDSKDKKRKRSQFEIEEDLSSSPSTLIQTAPTSTSTGPASAVVESPPATEPTKSAAPPRRFAHHRARLLNSKRIAGKSAAELAEVLGVAQTPASSSASTSTNPTPGTLTPISDPVETDSKVTTSNKSVSDYFREKMRKLQDKHTWMKEDESGSQPTQRSNAPESKAEDDDEEDDRPRMGLGASKPTTFASTSGLAPMFGRGLGFKAPTAESDTPSANTPPSSDSSPSQPMSTNSSVPTFELKPSKKEKRSQKDKGKEKEVETSTPGDDALDVPATAEDAKREQKRRKKEEKARRKELEIQATSSLGQPAADTRTAVTDEDTEKGESLVKTPKESKEERRKRKEEKRARKVAAASTIP